MVSTIDLVALTTALRQIVNQQQQLIRLRPAICHLCSHTHPVPPQHSHPRAHHTSALHTPPHDHPSSSTHPPNLHSTLTTLNTTTSLSSGPSPVPLTRVNPFQPRYQSSVATESQSTDATPLPYVPSGRRNRHVAQIEVQGRVLNAGYEVPVPMRNDENKVKVPNQPAKPFVMKDPLIPLDFDRIPKQERTNAKYNQLRVRGGGGLWGCSQITFFIYLVYLKCL